MHYNTELVYVNSPFPQVRDWAITYTLSAFTILSSKNPWDYFELSIGIKTNYLTIILYKFTKTRVGYTRTCLPAGR